MGEWDSLQLKDGPNGHAPIFNPPDFALMLTTPEIKYNQKQFDLQKQKGGEVDTQHLQINTPSADHSPRDNSATQTGSSRHHQRQHENGNLNLPAMGVAHQLAGSETDQHRNQARTDATANQTQTATDAAQRNVPSDRAVPQTLSDATLQNAVHNGTLELKYGDANMDQYLRYAKYQNIDMQVPPTVDVKHWIDPNGNFFWMQGGNDNGARHYYPPTAQTMTVNGKTVDLVSQRLKVDEAYASSAGGFQSFTGKTDAVTYFSRMSGLSSQTLKTLENSLTGSVQTSDNPYFKIYLADVYTAEAMQPIVQQVLQTGSATLNNPETVQKLNQAIQLTQAAQSDSSKGLGRMNLNPPGNTVMPLDPYEIYANPQSPQYYYGFWGGSLDQARHRQVALTTIRDLILNNALPKIELPPALPPG